MKRNRHKSPVLKILLWGITVGLLVWVFYSYFYASERELGASPVLYRAEAQDLSTRTDPGTIDYLPVSEGEVVRHTHYTLSYNVSHKQANWVYYIPKIKIDTKAAKRTDDFREDPLVGHGSAKPSDYAKSGYDRGHLCPAGDMTLSAEAMSETFYMSNMSPQIPGFNRGIWKSLEEQVRKWGKRELIYVVTGPVFKSNKGQIGQNKVTVPGYYYKVIYAPTRQEMIGFILPNEKTRKTWEDYVVSVDSVENFTGINFFSQLPDSLENRLEARSEYKKW